MAAVDKPQPHLLDGRVGIDAPGCIDLEIAAPVHDHAVALAVRDAVGRGRIPPGRGRDAPELAGAHVLQQKPLARRVGERIVRPRRQLVQAAVQRPAVAAAGLGDVGTETRVREHVDPGPCRPLKNAHIEAKLATLGHEVAPRDARFGTGAPTRAGGDRQFGDRRGVALLERRLVLLGPLLQVVGERAAVGVEVQPRQRAQRAELVGRELVGTQYREAGRHGAGRAAVLRRELLAQRRDLVLQGHQVRGRFGIDHDQVAGQAGPRPDAQCLHQGAQQPHALGRASRNQHDRPVARDAEAPQQPAVAGLGRRPFDRTVLRTRSGDGHHDRGRQRLDRRVGLGVDRELAQADAGEGGRHQRGALDRALLAVLVDHRVERRATVGGRGAEGQSDLAVGRELHPHRERAHRVEAGPLWLLGLGRLRQRCERCQRLARIAVAAEPAEPVGLHPGRDHLRVVLCQEVRRVQAGLGRQSRLALEHQRLLCRAPGRAQEQVRECRVRLIRARVGERDLEGRHQFEIERALTQVAQLDLAELDVVFGADPDGGVCVDLGPHGIEAHAVGVIGARVVRRRVGSRVLGDRHGLRLAIPAHVEERAVRVAQQVVARARDADVAPAAPARTIGAQRDAVAAVREQVRRRQRHHARHELAQHAGHATLARVGRGLGRRFEQHRDLTWRTLVQQRADGLDVRVRHAPTARRAVEQHVGDRDDAHALVVRHEGVDAGEAAGVVLATGAEVERLDETVAGARRQRLHQREVRDREVRRDLCRECSRIRRDHELVGRCAAQCRARHALRRVLIGERVVARRVGRLRDAPGHVVLARERDLLADRRLAGAAQHAAGGLVEHQRRHQVLEHRARPRSQPGVRADRVERPAESGPVLDRHVALGDREQAGQARFGGEQVVEAGVELLLGDAVADVEQVPLAVVQEREIGLPGERLAARGNRLQAVHRIAIDRRLAARVGALRLRIQQRAAQGDKVVGGTPCEQSQRVGRERSGIARQHRAELDCGAAQQPFEPFGALGDVGQRVGQREQTLQCAVGRDFGCGGTQRLDAGLRAHDRTPRRARVVRRTRQLEAGLRDGEQVAAQIAAVDGRDVHWEQRGLALGVVPIEEVAAVPRQLGEARERRLEPGDQFVGADPAELARARGRQQVQPDVGRRGAVRDQRFWRELQVVGRQEVVVGADTSLEQAPGVACRVFEVGLVGRRQRGVALRRPRAADPPGPQR